jgi:hypothetical protein
MAPTPQQTSQQLTLNPWDDSRWSRITWYPLVRHKPRRDDYAEIVESTASAIPPPGLVGAQPIATPAERPDPGLETVGSAGGRHGNDGWIDP